jgi:hypothetical protein
MVTKFNDYSGIIGITINNIKLYFHLSYDENKIPFEVKLEIPTGYYDNLSIIIPDSKKLGHKEFFINPKIDNKIISSLVKENFIEESGQESIAGEDKTTSYILLI